MSSNQTTIYRHSSQNSSRLLGGVYTCVLLAVVLGYVMLLPPQFNASFGSSVVPPYRFFLIASTLYIVGSLSRSIWRFLLVDYLMLIAIFWTGFSLYLNSNSDFTAFFTSTIAQAADVGLSYFFARAAFRSIRDFRLFLLMMAPGFALIAAILVVESVTKTHILQPFVQSLLGTGGGYPLVDIRLGLMRAAGPFAHPILAGIVMASLLSLYWFSGLRRWPLWIGVGAAAGSFFTVSSAALLGLVLGAGLIAYNWMTEKFVNLTWKLFFTISGILFLALELGTESGTFNLLVRYASLNSVSSYYRTLIWKYGSLNVEQHPWFGIGYGDWDRPQWMTSSVDNYWLLQAIQFGIMPPLIYFIIIILAVIGLSRRSNRENLVDQRTLRGIAISMAVMALGALSVSVWLSAQVWFHLLMGISVSMASGLKPLPRRGIQPVMRPQGLGLAQEVRPLRRR